jgi:hypothetical protein
MIARERCRRAARSRRGLVSGKTPAAHRFDWSPGHWAGGSHARRLNGRMARVEFSREIVDDFERFFDHMARFAVEDTSAKIGGIVEAVQLLTHSPLIGRPVKGGKRELVMGRE